MWFSQSRTVATDRTNDGQLRFAVCTVPVSSMKRFHSEETCIYMCVCVCVCARARARAFDFSVAVFVPVNNLVVYL